MNRSHSFRLVSTVHVFASIALSLCALATASAPFSAQTQREARATVHHDAARLRRGLTAAIGGEFEIVRDMLTRRSTYQGAGAYWLVHVRPKRSGQFKLKYKYKYNEEKATADPRYTHVEHEIRLGVGPRACRREPRYMSDSYAPCLGDTIILPFAIEAYQARFTEHEFEFKVVSIVSGAAEASKLEEWKEAERRRQEAGLQRDAVANPVAEHLKYLGSAVHIHPHRSPGFTAEYHATFEAVKPGSFNLSLGLSAHASSQSGQKDAGGIPIVIVARGTPVTWLAAQESVHGYSGRFGSHSGNSYLTSPVIMQPGERLTLSYHSFSRRGFEAIADSKRVASERHEPPVITRLPFYVAPDDSFNEWIVDYLPTRRTRKRGK